MARATRDDDPKSISSIRAPAHKRASERARSSVKIDVSRARVRAIMMMNPLMRVREYRRRRRDDIESGFFLHRGWDVGGFPLGGDR